MLDTDAMERLRVKLGLTQEQAAQRAGLSGRKHWNDVVQGRRANVTMQTLDRIAKALGCKPKDLVK